MERWLIYDVHQQRFIKTLNNSTMKEYIRPFASWGEAMKEILEMGCPYLLPIKSINARESIKQLDKEGRTKC